MFEVYSKARKVNIRTTILFVKKMCLCIFDYRRYTLHWEIERKPPFKVMVTFELSHFFLSRSADLERSQRRNKLNNLSRILYIRNETKMSNKTMLKKGKSNKIPYRNKLSINNFSLSFVCVFFSLLFSCGRTNERAFNFSIWF